MDGTCFSDVGLAAQKAMAAVSQDTLIGAADRKMAALAAAQVAAALEKKHKVQREAEEDKRQREKGSGAASADSGLC